MKKILLSILLLLLGYNAEAATKLTVILDWFPNPDHAPLFIAQKKGFFQQQGLDVLLITPSNPSDAVKLVADKKADIAIAYGTQYPILIQQHIPVIQIATLINHPLACLAVLQSSDIKNIADLKGKKIAISDPAVDPITLKIMLEKNGLSLQDVTLVNVNYNLTQALLSHQVDAAIGMMRNFEPIEMALAGQPARVFYPEENGVPSYPELILVTHSDDKNDPRFRNFLIALNKAVLFLKEHPEQGWKLMIADHPELNNELNHTAWEITAQGFDLNL